VRSLSKRHGEPSAVAFVFVVERALRARFLRAVQDGEFGVNWREACAGAPAPPKALLVVASVFADEQLVVIANAVVTSTFAP
jgi:hypothetical protein